MLRRTFDLDEAKGTTETKGELSREDVHDILQGIPGPLHEDDPAVVDSRRARGAAHTYGQRPQGLSMRLWRV